MNDLAKEKNEKRILNLSFAGSLVMVASELATGILLHSYSVLMDGIFGVADLVLMGPFLMLIPLLYKPVTERKPYGYSQVESLFLLIKYGILLFIIGQMVIENIKLILRGGHHVDVNKVAVFEMIMFVGSLFMYALILHFSNHYRSITIQAELFLWKVDIISSIGLSAAFFTQGLFANGFLAFLTPYIDSVVAIVSSLFLMHEPITEIIASVKKLLLFAPPKSTMDEIRQVAEEGLKTYNYKLSFLDVIQTGRKTWVEVYIESTHQTIHIAHLSMVSAAIRKSLSREFDQVYVELIPVLPDSEEKLVEQRVEELYEREINSVD